MHEQDDVIADVGADVGADVTRLDAGRGTGRHDDAVIGRHGRHALPDPAGRRRRRIAKAVAATAVAVLAAAAVASEAPKAAAESYLVAKSGSVTILGRGFGHGHGMSQYGAQGRAVAGQSAKQILDFYYPGTASSRLGGAIRVQLAVDSTGHVEVSPASGLAITDLATGARTSLPRATFVGHWELTGNGDHGTRLSYYHTTQHRWVSWKTFAGMAQFSGPQLIALWTSSSRAHLFRGALRSADRSGTSLASVNVLSLDQYTMGVVAAESPSSWRPAALQAQAIAARTFAANARLHPRAHDYDICATTSCQVYGGYGSETANTNTAVAATSGLVRTYKGAPILAQFSSSNGGATSASDQPYLVARPDPFDYAPGAHNPNASWKRTVSVASLQSNAGVGQIRQIIVTGRSGGGPFGGRLLTATIVGSSGSRAVTGNTIRRWYGLKSNYLSFGQSAIITYWQSLGGTHSVVGTTMPGHNEFAVAGGSGQVFSRGQIYARSAGTVAPVFGGMLARWTQLGATSSHLGLPAGKVYAGKVVGLRVQPYANGWMYSTPARTISVYGAQMRRYAVMGGETSPLGLPVGEFTGSKVRGIGEQQFAGGRIYYGPSMPYARPVTGELYRAYVRAGMESGRLGLPISFSYSIVGGQQQLFEHGWISTVGGVVRIGLR